MAECIVLKGGGGADLDVITAGAGDVLAGKVAVDKDGNPLPGTMPNRGTGYHGVGAGLNTQGLYYYIGPGYYYENPTNNPWVYMSRAEVAATLGIEPWKMRGDVNVCGVQGGIPMQNPDVSGTDRVRATSMSNWAGTINLQVRNGHYLNGVNWVQQDIPNYQPWNIKKGVNIGGVVGTFEGYVPTATDLYLRGNNIAGWDNANALGVTFDAGQITLKNVTGGNRHIAATVNAVGFNYINFEIYVSGSITSNSKIDIYSFANAYPKGGVAITATGTYTVSIPVAGAQMYGRLDLLIKDFLGAIYRIWFS